MVRRLVVALMVVVVMAATMGAVAAQAASAAAATGGASSAQASTQRVPGQPYCGPYQTAWYISYGLYWYAWVWRWCYNPSLQNPWYVDWVNWYWDGYAGPSYSPGYQYSVPYITQ